MFLSIINSNLLYNWPKNVVKDFSRFFNVIHHSLQFIVTEKKQIWWTSDLLILEHVCKSLSF